MPAKSLLIVDDDQTFRELLARALRDRGYVVSIAADTAGALAVVDEHEFAAAFVDAHLGTESGLELVTLLRRRLPELRVLVITAAATPDTVADAKSRGALACMNEIADADQMLEAVLHRAAD